MHAIELLFVVPGAVGRRSLSWAGEAGRAFLFLLRCLAAVFRRPFRLTELILQAHFIGNRSLLIILLSATFTGLVLVLQGYYALARLGGEVYLGPLVALSLIRELGPVLGALMITARAGSSIAATIGSMRVSEQIDALEALAVDPLHYLAAPRLVAALLVGPMLIAIFDLAGIAAAYVFGVRVLGLDGGAFLATTRAFVAWSDVAAGLWKSLVFMVIIVWIAVYRGFMTSQGARGIGIATTRAVVITTALILAADYVITALLF